MAVREPPTVKESRELGANLLGQPVYDGTLPHEYGLSFVTSSILLPVYSLRILTN